MRPRRGASWLPSLVFGALLLALWWFFTTFGFVDAYFVPVISRFATYGIESSGAASSYRSTVLALPTYNQWLDEARAESLSIAKYEYDDPA